MRGLGRDRIHFVDLIYYKQSYLTFLPEANSTTWTYNRNVTWLHIAPRLALMHYIFNKLWILTSTMTFMTCLEILIELILRLKSSFCELLMVLIIDYQEIEVEANPNMINTGIWREMGNLFELVGINFPNQDSFSEQHNCFFNRTEWGSSVNLCTPLDHHSTFFPVHVCACPSTNLLPIWL